MAPSGMTPVILIGAGRSGTKFVRDCLAVAPDVARVPYDISYVWRTGNDTCEHDEFTAEHVARAPRETIRRTIERMARSEGKVDAPILVEKSVPNSLRPGFVAEVMPDARFIHLIRDGRDVTESAIRMWQGPREAGHILRKLRYFPLTNYRYGMWYAGNLLRSKLSPNKQPPMWGPRYRGMDEDIRNGVPLVTICARQWRRCVEVAREQLAVLPEDRVFEVRFEDLVADPDIVRRMAVFCGTGHSETVVERFKAAVERENVGKWRRKMSEADIALMTEELGALVAELGYT